jgi:hypothetical protein
MPGSYSMRSFILASTQELHEKITELCSRIRDLEDALRTSHIQNSSEPHPLLSEEQLRIKAPLQREAPPRNPTTIHQQEEENNPDVIDSFGTLAINGSGHTNYYGQFANSWVSRQLASRNIRNLTSFVKSTSYRFGYCANRFSSLLTVSFQNEMECEAKDDARLRGILPAEILQFSGSLPLTPLSRPSVDTVKERLRNLHWYLPSAEKAAELRDLYYTYAAWMSAFLSHTNSSGSDNLPDLGTIPSRSLNLIPPFIRSFISPRGRLQQMMSQLSCYRTGYQLCSWSSLSGASWTHVFLHTMLKQKSITNSPAPHFSRIASLTSRLSGQFKHYT